MNPTVNTQQTKHPAPEAPSKRQIYRYLAIGTVPLLLALAVAFSWFNWGADWLDSRLSASMHRPWIAAMSPAIGLWFAVLVIATALVFAGVVHELIHRARQTHH